MSSKIIETTHEKQNPSGQTNSIKGLQVKSKQQDGKMTNLENSEDNAWDPDHLSRILQANQIKKYVTRKRNNKTVECVTQEKLRRAHKKSAA